MSGLKLPDTPTDKIKLADWLEIKAIISPDQNASIGDLERALKISSVLESNSNQDEAIEQKCLEVISELEERALAACDSYPYIIEGGTLELKEGLEKYSAYVFCLCLSYFRWSTKRFKEIDINPWHLFEELSAIAAAKYLDGHVFILGTSRRNRKKYKNAFKEAVNQLCKLIGEGNGYREQPSQSTKDDKVDLIAWKDFRDMRTSKLIMFGQCAGGNNWTMKLTDLDPHAFWSQWIVEGSVSPHLRSFYIPHRVHRNKWDHHARRAHIMFDRCRIAYWAFLDNATIIKDKRYRKWYKHILKTA